MRSVRAPPVFVSVFVRAVRWQKWFPLFPLCLLLNQQKLRCQYTLQLIVHGIHTSKKTKNKAIDTLYVSQTDVVLHETCTLCCYYKHLLGVPPFWTYSWLTVGSLLLHVLLVVFTLFLCNLVHNTVQSLNVSLFLCHKGTPCGISTVGSEQ